MPADVVMPKLGLTMTSGTITAWLKAPGDRVRAGEPLLEIATDKINYEVDSPAEGTLVRVSGAPGDEFECGAVIGAIALLGETPVAAAVNGAVLAGRTVASPAARKSARELGVPLSAVRGSGPRGRITLRDVQGASVEAKPRSPVLQPPASRRAIFKKMEGVGLLPLAHVETIARVDALCALIDLRGDFGWTAYAVLAAARTLRDHEIIRTDAASGLPFDSISIGVAVDTPQGLIVPVVRDAAQRTLAGVQIELRRLVEAARAGTLSARDVGGASFSISNVGPQKIERVVPLPDPPQTAILGIGAATLRPAVVAGALVPARLLDCVLSFDHRYIDGAPAARFLRAFADVCEHPGLLA